MNNLFSYQIPQAGVVNDAIETFIRKGFELSRYRLIDEIGLRNNPDNSEIVDLIVEKGGEFTVTGVYKTSTGHAADVVMFNDGSIAGDSPGRSIMQSFYLYRHEVDFFEKIEEADVLPNQAPTCSSEKAIELHKMLF